MIAATLFLWSGSVDATHMQENTTCVVSIKSKTFPVMYNEEPRNNPDGSYYPGDAFHYLFVYSASDTCLGFIMPPTKAVGPVDITSNDIITQKHTLSHDSTHLQ